MVCPERESPFGKLLSRRPLERLQRALTDRGSTTEEALGHVSVLESFYRDYILPRVGPAESIIGIYTTETDGYEIILGLNKSHSKYEREGKRGMTVNWKLFREEIKEFNKELERRLFAETSGKIPMYFTGDLARDRETRAVHREIIDVLGISIEEEDATDSFLGSLSRLMVINETGRFI